MAIRLKDKRTTWCTADYALSVAEFEIARSILDRSAWVFGGGYSLDGDEVSDFGCKVGARGYLNENILLELSISDDDTFGTNTVFSMVWFPGRFPAFGQRQEDIHSRLREPVIRNEYVVTRQEAARGCLPLTDEDDTPICVVHVKNNAPGSNDGTYESPFTSLNDVSTKKGSKEGDIILVHSGSTFNGESVILKDLQRLLGEGNDVGHMVTTSELGQVRLPETSPGALSGLIPEITDAPSTVQNPGDPEGGAAIILAAAEREHDVNADDYDPNDPISFNEVSNLKIVRGPNGIISNGFTTDTTTGEIVSRGVGIAEADINNMTIENTTGDGIVLTPFIEVFDDNGTKTRKVRFNPTINTVAFSSVGGDDIHLDATTDEPDTTTVVEDIQIQNVESTNGNGWGINITNNKSAATIDQYTFNGGTTAIGGIRFESSPAGANVTSSLITGGSGASGIGVSLVGATKDSFAGTFTFSDVTIENTGGAGFHVKGDATNVNFTGLITQKVNAQAAIFVEGDGDGAHTGTLNFNEQETDKGVVEATTGTGLVFKNADGTYKFNDPVNVYKDTGPSAPATPPITGITIGKDVNGNGSDGTFTFASDSEITSTSGTAFTVDGSEATVTYNGTIDNSAGRAVEITNNTGGTVTFGGKIEGSAEGVLVHNNTGGTFQFNGLLDLDTSANNAVTLTTNNGATTRFANLDIDTTSGAGFTATGGGTVEVTGSSNTINTTTGVAVSMDGVEIGGSGAKFESVSAGTTTSGPTTSGIVLNDLTGAGTLTINGGTIQKTTSHGIAITNVANLSLNNMSIKNTGDDGISLTHGNNASLNVTIADCNISSTTGEGIYLNANGAGSMRLTLNDNQISQTSLEGVEILVGANAGNNTHITMDGNSITNSNNEEAFLMTINGGTVTFKAENGSFVSNNADSAFDVQVKPNSQFYATIHDNIFNNSNGLGFRMTNTGDGATIRLSLLDNRASSASQPTMPFQLVNNASSAGAFSVEKRTTPVPADPAVDQEPDVNMRNGADDRYDPTDPSTWIIDFQSDFSKFTTDPGDIPTP